MARKPEKQKKNEAFFSYPVANEFSLKEIMCSYLNKYTIIMILE